MVDYTPMGDVYAAYSAGTLDEIGFSGFDIDKNLMDVIELLAHFTASAWENEWLKTQFFLKGYDFYPTGDLDAGQAYYKTDYGLLSVGWAFILAHPNRVTMDKNTKDCVNKIFELWTWDNF